MAALVQLKAGEYLIPQTASIRQVIDIIAEGKTVTYKVTIPEGLTSEQIVERLKADNSLAGEIAAGTGRGLAAAGDLHRAAWCQLGNRSSTRCKAESRKLSEKMWDQRKKDLPFKTWEEAVILASIVEKETGRNDERERVAAVFINRLKQKMRLQSDPTIVYGISGGKAVWNRPILEARSRRRQCTTPIRLTACRRSPICNPGKAAIEAVLNPADTKDLFFVADGTGGHIFSETLKDHNTNVQKWRAVEKELKAKTVPAPPPGDTPTTAQPKTRAVVRTPPEKKAPQPAIPARAQHREATRTARVGPPPPSRRPSKRIAFPSLALLHMSAAVRFEYANGIRVQQRVPAASFLLWHP